MSKKLEVGATLAALLGFVALLMLTSAAGSPGWGGLLSLVAFVVGVSYVGYTLAERAYDDSERAAES
ncbi:MAG: hypothetical protein ACLFMT_01970 [Halobacteriales archaeon]